jgi:hypothetical protein
MAPLNANHRQRTEIQIILRSRLILADPLPDQFKMICNDMKIMPEAMAVGCTHEAYDKADIANAETKPPRESIGGRLFIWEKYAIYNCEWEPAISHLP